ncbi:MAG: hypothetical protein ACLQB4_08890, partial [Beijerinckiaceae bacterium]
MRKMTAASRANCLRQGNFGAGWSELGVDPNAADRDRAAIGVVAGVGDEILARMDFEMEAFKHAMNSHESQAAFKAFLKGGGIIID